jgi:anti-anti-sigma factor
MPEQDANELLRIRVQRIDGAPVVYLTGELDLSTIGELATALDQLEGSLVVDLEGVSFMDSSGIRTIVAARKRVLDDGGDLQLRAPQAHVRRVLEITGLDAVIA